MLLNCSRCWCFFTVGLAGGSCSSARVCNSGGGCVQGIHGSGTAPGQEIIARESGVPASFRDHLARAVRSASTSLANVRRVVYHREQDIPWLLRTGGTSVPRPAGLRVEGAPFIPSRVSAEPVQEAMDGDEDTPGDDCHGSGGRHGEHRPGH
ncbi:hypothetical protein OH77DRAFT_635660 [Trametes cingulata]|nr:hypothetical protein OH77DRAFT_635660 [Trametes cingulata]